MPIGIIIFLQLIWLSGIGPSESYAQTMDSENEIHAVVSFTVKESGYYHFKLFNLSKEPLNYFTRKGNIAASKELWWDGNAWRESNLGSWCAEGFITRVLNPGESVILRVLDIGYGRFRIGIMCTNKSGTLQKTIWSPEVSGDP